MRAKLVLVGTLMMIASGFAPAVWGTEDAPSASFGQSLLAELNSAPMIERDVFFTYDRDVSLFDLNALSAKGLMPIRVFDDWNIVFATGTGASILEAATLPGVIGAHPNSELEFFGNTATVATRARESWDAKSTSTNPVMVGGSVVDGTGVTVAVVDSGVDGTHPDLAPAMVQNRKFVCTTPGLISTATNTCFGATLLGSACADLDGWWVSLEDTDTTSGHGTHVAGTVAGRGVASDGRFMGSAPGAGLVGLSTGEGLSILFAMEAFAWIDCFAATHGIGVVSNSWGLVAVYDPTDPINVAVDDLVSDGIAVLFAAGNDAGTGTTDMVNMYARNPTPGVISVANYDDADTATRTGDLDPSSSRCHSTTPGSAAAKCPDVSAPGTGIVSTRARTGLAVDAVGHPLSGDGRFLCCAQSTLQYSPYYVGITGTSMATPHVAGIVALLLQANPSLTPAAVEDVLEDTAFQFTTSGGYSIADASNPTNGLDFGAGHGLVDAIAALEDSRVLGGSGTGSPLPQLSHDPHVYLEGAVDLQFVGGVPSVIELQWSSVTGRPVDLAERALVSGNTVDWAISVGQTANVRVVAPSSTVTDLGTTLAADTVGLQMSAAYTFPAPGEYLVESQIDFGNGLVSFDNFAVRVVP